MADAAGSPLAYGLFELPKARLILTNVYAGSETAAAAAARLTNGWRTVMAIPLFGPDALVTLQDHLEASRTAEETLRREAIHLRNQMAERRGQAVAEAHAAGLPASEADHG
jgi:hypothetical protein